MSAAQVKRCELVSGDRIGGPVRAPRRSERFPSLVRVDTINGKPADEVAEGTRFEDLPAALPAERIALDSEDVDAQGRRVADAVRQGLTRRHRRRSALRQVRARARHRRRARRAARASRCSSCWPASARRRPATGATPAPAAALTFSASPDAQAQAVEQAIEQGRRVAARGGDAVVVVDTLEYVPPHAARRALAAARNIADGGSLTVIATAPAPFGGETTVIALDAR